MNWRALGKPTPASNVFVITFKKLPAVLSCVSVFYRTIVTPFAIIAITVAVLTAISFPSSGLVYADGGIVVDQVRIVVPVSCTLDGTGMDSHIAEIQNREYETEIGSTSLKAYCNDDNGFAIYAVGYSNDVYGSTDLIGQNTEELIPTGTTLDGTVSNWAMKLSTTLDPAPAYPITIQNNFSSYHAVPSTYMLVASRDSFTDIGVAAIGSVLTTTYAASASATQVADTYVGKVRYTLVHPSSEVPPQPQTANSGCINYFANASNAVGTMGCQPISDSDTSAVLIASNFSRDGYGFAGWSDAFDYETNPNAKFYGPNETISFTAEQYTGANPGLSLYAVWVKSVGDFQDSTKVAELCGNGANALAIAPTDGTANLSSVSALTDHRDGQTYAIAKLADGNCWMVENLRLSNASELTLANTNNPLNDGAKVTLKHNYADTDTYSTLSPTSNVVYDADTSPEGWCEEESDSCNNQSRLRTDNTVNRRTYAFNANMSGNANLYSYGNYYNWYSATAGHGTYDFNSNNNSTTGDICPIGWRLPQGGNKSRIRSMDDNDYWNLIADGLNGGTYPSNYDSSSTPYYVNPEEASLVDALIRKYPTNLVRSGCVSVTSLYYRGAGGYYWSSTANSPEYAYSLYFQNTYVHPGTNGRYKYYGWTVRCLASSGT